MSSSNQRPANRGFRSVLRCAISHYRQFPLAVCTRTISAKMAEVNLKTESSFGKMPTPRLRSSWAQAAASRALQFRCWVGRRRTRSGKRPSQPDVFAGPSAPVPAHTLLAIQTRVSSFRTRRQFSRRCPHIRTEHLSRDQSRLVSFPFRPTPRRPTAGDLAHRYPRSARPLRRRRQSPPPSEVFLAPTPFPPLQTRILSVITGYGVQESQ